MLLSLRRFALPASAACVFGLFSSSAVALAQADAGTPIAEVGATTAGSAPIESTFVSDGAPLKLETLGATITPPKGWEVRTNSGSLSVVMREPGQSETADHTKYQRNITIAAIHQASPIDEKRAVSFQQDLVKNFGADASVADFKILEHKFFNYRGENDGLLVYSSFRLGDFPMMQMHVLVSGSQEQLLLTYTDLATQFGNEKDPSYSAAWDSMVSAQLVGDSPSRNAEYLRYGEIAGCLLVLIFGCMLLRLRASRRDYRGEADALIDADDAEGNLHRSQAAAHGSSVSMLSAISSFGTQAGSWKLSDSRPARKAKTQESAAKAPKERSSVASSHDWPTSTHAQRVPAKTPSAPQSTAKSAVVRSEHGAAKAKKASHLSAVSALSDFDFTSSVEPRTRREGGFSSH